MDDIIDSHHHLWNYIAEEHRWISDDMEVLKRDFLPQQLLNELASSDVDGSIVVQARQTVEETEWLLSVAGREPAIRGVIGWLPLTDQALPGLLDRFREQHKLKGLRHVVQDEADPAFILRDVFNRGIENLTHAGLVFDILIRDHQLPYTLEFVKRHPNQIFVLDHLAKPKVRKESIEPWRTQLCELAECQNVLCKLSGLCTESDSSPCCLDELRPYLDVALQFFGADRLMAGSDWPVCLLRSSYRAWWSTLREWMRNFPIADQSAILGGTATRVYQLKQTRKE